VTKLLWVIGALAAFLLVMFGVAYYALAEFFGGDSSAPAFGIILAAVLSVVLGATYKTVFVDRWPN
jgi:uncharacterized membrane protein